MTYKLRTEEVKEILNNAQSLIKTGQQNDWISISNLVTRAYYLGLLAGIDSICSPKDLEGFYVTILKDTMFSTDLDQKISEAIELRKNNRSDKAN